MSGRQERVVLNPVEVAGLDRIELDLHTGAIQVGPDGIDWGQAEIDAFMAKRAVGQVPIDYEIPNRVISIPLILGAVGDFDAARIAIQAETGRIFEEGATLKREIIGGSYGEAGKHVFADIVKATLNLSGGSEQAAAGFDPNAMLTLEALPEFYGDPIALSLFEGIGEGSQVAQVKGNMPGRVELTVTDKSGEDVLGVGWHFRCRNYSAEESAAWSFEAEHLTPLDSAAIVSDNALSAGKGIKHSNLNTSWTPVCSLSLLPRVRAVGAAVSGTGAVAPPLPAGVKENDILVMFLETDNQAVTPPAGWEHITGSPVSVATGTTTRLTALWKRAGAAEVAPTVADPGDHVIARILAVSGCIKSGNPWNTASAETELVSDTSASMPSVTTTIDGCLILNAVATGTDITSSAHITGWTNANLQDLTEQIDSWAADGTGGGFGVSSGVKVKAGATGATTATVGTANFKALMTIALKPESGGNFPTHAGVYDVWARAESRFDLPWLRLVWDVGDVVAPVVNDPMRLYGSGEENPYLMYLGQVDLRKSPFGAHRWQGVVQGRGEEGGEDIVIDKVYFFCADEGSGIPRGAVLPNMGAVGFTARDGFPQAAAALNAVAISDGSGTWATSGSAKGDFATTGSGKLTRTAKEDAEVRRAVASGNSYTQGAIRVKFRWSALPTEPSTLLESSLLAHELKGSCAAVYEVSAAGVARSILRGGGAGFNVTMSYPWRAEVDYTLVFMPLTNVTAAVWVVEGGGDPVGPPLLIAPFSPATWTAGIVDRYNGKQAITRTYDDFATWIPTPDMAIFANRNMVISDKGIYRQAADGKAYGSVAYPGSDLPRIPVSGPEKRPVEIAVRVSRGDFAAFPDYELMPFQAQVSYRPCWSGIPES